MAIIASTTASSTAVTPLTLPALPILPLCTRTSLTLHDRSLHRHCKRDANEWIL